jgi:hypothetical protein
MKKLIIGLLILAALITAYLKSIEKTAYNWHNPTPKLTIATRAIDELADKIIRISDAKQLDKLDEIARHLPADMIRNMNLNARNPFPDVLPPGNYGFTLVRSKELGDVAVPLIWVESLDGESGDYSYWARWDWTIKYGALAQKSLKAELQELLLLGLKASDIRSPTNILGN